MLLLLLLVPTFLWSSFVVSTARIAISRQSVGLFVMGVICVLYIQEMMECGVLLRSIIPPWVQSVLFNE